MGWNEYVIDWATSFPVKKEQDGENGAENGGGGAEEEADALRLRGSSYKKSLTSVSAITGSIIRSATQRKEREREREREREHIFENAWEFIAF